MGCDKIGMCGSELFRKFLNVSQSQSQIKTEANLIMASKTYSGKTSNPTFLQ